MAITNHERIGKALELLRAGLGLFVDREFERTYPGRGVAEARRLLGEDPLNAKGPMAEWDVAALFRLMCNGNVWQFVFRKTLGPVERGLVSDLREVRNRWAHQKSFPNDDAERDLDSVARLLKAVSALQQADEVRKMWMDLRGVLVRRRKRGPAPEEPWRWFFRELIDGLQNRGITGAVYRPPSNCINIYRTPYPGARYGLTFGRGRRVRAEVFIDVDDKGKNKRLFDALARGKQAVEAEFGEPLVWERLDDGKGSRIALYRTGSIKDDDKMLQAIKTWAIDRLVKFKKVFDPRLAQLRSLG